MTGKVRTRFTRELLQEVLISENEDVPEDGTLVGIEYQSNTDCYVAVFESDVVRRTWEGSAVPWAYELEDCPGCGHGLAELDSECPACGWSE